MVLMYRMRICIRLLSSALKVFATNKTTVHINVGQADRTEFLEVEIEGSAVYLRDGDMRGS